MKKNINIIDKNLFNKAEIKKLFTNFNVKKFSNYGKLSGKTIEKLKSGIRISVDNEKQNPVDFALWKFSNEKPWTKYFLPK